MSTRSLGRLTLDLVARTGQFLGPMDRASRQTKKNFSDMEKQARRLGVAVTAAVTAYAASMVVMVNTSRQTIDEQAKLAVALGGTMEGMDGLARAGGRAGVSTEELRAAATRLNQALGTAIQLGGPAADTLRRLNLNAEELSRMDVDERFAAIANRMQEMRLSTQLAGAELRNLGIRQSSVITLMQAGGDAIEQSRLRLQQYGVTLSDIDAAKVEQMNDALEDLSIISTGFARHLTVQLAPAIEAVTILLTDAAVEAGGVGAAVESAFEKAITGAAFAADAVDGFTRVVKVSGRALAVLALQIEAWSIEAAESIRRHPISALDEMLQKLNLSGTPIGIATSVLRAREDAIAEGQSDIEALKRAIEIGMQDIDQILSEPLFGSMFKDLVEQAQEASQATAEATVAARRAAGGAFGAIEDDAGEAEKAQKRLQNAFESAMQSYHRQIALFGETTEAQRLAYDVQHGNLVGINAEQQRRLELMAAELDMLQEAKRLADEQDQINKEARSVAEGLRTEEEAIRESYERRRKIILDNTEITGEAQAELLRRLEERTAEDLLKINGSYWERWLLGAEEALTSFDDLAGNAIENFTRGVGSALEGVIFDFHSLGDAGRSVMEGIARSTVNALGQMAAQWVAYQAVQLALGRSTEAAAIAGAAATGASMAAAYAPAAAAASLASFGANAAPAMAGITSTHALSQSMALMGVAHDGIDAIPQTGTWLLEKGERVTTAQTSAKLDATLERIQRDQRGGGGGTVVNIIESRERAGERESRIGPDGREEENIFVADIMGDGPRSKAIQRAFGLQRRGY